MYSIDRHYSKNRTLGRRENKRRKDAARFKAREYQRKIDYPKTCHICGGEMSWCSLCEMWSSNCCCDYGTCMCS
jgi:hypothetical protein